MRTRFIALLIGDYAFLEPMKLANRYETLGAGKLALIYSKSQQIEELEDIKKSETKSISMPEHNRTIYGNAAMQCLNNLDLLNSIKSKLVENDSVPQVGSYVALGEVDAGFVNLTEALAQEGKIGGYLLAPDSCYEPIVISSAVIKNHESNPSLETWLEYIKTNNARQILSKYGLD